MSRVLILGTGLGGLEVTTRLSASLSGEAQVTLIDGSDSLFLDFSKLDVLLGRCAADRVLLPSKALAPPGVEFRQELITATDAKHRHVRTENGSYEADFLVIAQDAEYEPTATAGFIEDGYYYFTVAGAERLRDALASFEGGPE